MKYYVILFVLMLSVSCKTPNPDSVELKVFQFNIWQEGTVVENGYSAIVDEIIHSNAHLIALSEVRNYKDTRLDQRLVRSLYEKGYTFYSGHSQDTGLLSKFPILEYGMLYMVNNDHGSITKAIIDVHGIEIAFYSGHFDYLNCALYLPRGYDGSTWEKLEKPITDLEEIEAVNLASNRDEQTNALIADALKEIKKGRLVIYGGDNNEPSHLDWTDATKDLFDHNGLVIPWYSSTQFSKFGFIDSYRSIHPNPLTHPGFTFPANNVDVDIKKLAWSPTADDRDRIDFIYYYPDIRLELTESCIVGPSSSIAYNKRVEETTEDIFLKPLTTWPTDHKGVLSTFNLSIK